MLSFLQNQTSRIYAVLRIVAGLLFACHGAQKVLGLLGGAGGSGHAAQLLSLHGVAGVIELVGGILIAIGLLTRYAAFITSGQMAVAYFMVHVPGGFWPIQNGGELAVLYCFLFLFIAASGTGIWGVQSD
jgi:putative oxidoreductase